MRGVGKDVKLIVADEWMFYDPGALPTILPTLATDATFIIISSVSPDGESPLRRILDTEYADGRKVFKMLNWIQVCLVKNRDREGEGFFYCIFTHMKSPVYDVNEEDWRTVVLTLNVHHNIFKVMVVKIVLIVLCHTIPVLTNVK